MKKYDFNEVVERRGTNCVKYDLLEEIYGNEQAIPMWVADTDFRVPDFIMDALKKRLDHDILAYSYRPESYFDAVIGWMKKRHHWNITREMISSSPGVVSAVTMLIMALSNPGDSVIVQPPVYFPFFMCIRGSDRKMVENPLKIVNGRFTFDFEQLERIIDERTKILVLCSPHNPGGTVWHREELERLTDICEKNGIVILSDEIHSDLILNGNQHFPLASISEKAAQNCAVLMAPSKTFNVAGLSSAIVIIPNKKIKVKYEKVIHTIHIDGGNVLGNIALEAAYKGGEEWLDQLIHYLDGNFAYLNNFILERLPKLKVMTPEATFLAWIDFSAYGLSEKSMAKRLAEGGVALNNGSRFGTNGEGFFRLNFGCPRTTLQEGLERLESVLNSLAIS